MNLDEDGLEDYLGNNIARLVRHRDHAAAAQHGRGQGAAQGYLRGSQVMKKLVCLLGLLFAGTAYAQTNVRFLHEWRFEGHVAPFLVALEKGHFKAEGVNVTVDPGTGSLDSINRVASGAYDMAIADINSLIRFRDNPANVPLKAVMMVYDSPPFAILTLKKNNIRTPKDLEGKVLGAPAADGAWAQLPDPREAQQHRHVQGARRQRRVPGARGAARAGQGRRRHGVRQQRAGRCGRTTCRRTRSVVLMMRRFGLELYGSAILAHPEFVQKPAQGRRRVQPGIDQGLPGDGARSGSRDRHPHEEESRS